MSNIDINLLMILSEPYSAVNLRNVAKSLAKSIIHPDSPHLATYTQLVGDLGAFGPLRNSVAHSTWAKSDRPGAIRVSGVDIRSGTAKFLGHDDLEKDWTAEELAEEANKLGMLNHRIVRFMDDSGITAAMDAKADFKNLLRVLSEGNSANA